MIHDILIVEDVEKDCLDILTSNGIQVVKKEKLTEKELKNEIINHDAILVRSATKITRSLIEHAKEKLRVILRAGTGTDNIDVAAATENGILVMNTPAANSRSACEMTCGCILALSRNIPQAVSSLKNGNWERKKYMGEEVFGKTLAIIGLGRIGIEVAIRMQAFGMNIIGYDPLVKADEASKKNIKWLPLEEIWPIADYTPLHVPLVPQTKDLISNKTLSLCKKGVKIINVARGGIVNEQDLLDFLETEHVGGAALDVYAEEPPKFKSILEHPKVICTPHLGASTFEAQRRVGCEIAVNVVALNKNIALRGAVNAPALNALLNVIQAKWIHAIIKIAKVVATLSPSSKHFFIKHPVEINNIQRSLASAVKIGVLQAFGIDNINLINADFHATTKGLTVEIESTCDEVLTIGAGEIIVCGYASREGAFITSINESKVPVPLLAAGTLAVSLDERFSTQSLLESSLKNKVAIEFGLMNKGRVALLKSLENSEIEELAKNFDVINF